MGDGRHQLGLCGVPVPGMSTAKSLAVTAEGRSRLATEATSGGARNWIKLTGFIPRNNMLNYVKPNKQVIQQLYNSYTTVIQQLYRLYRLYGLYRLYSHFN